MKNRSRLPRFITLAFSALVLTFACSAQELSWTRIGPFGGAQISALTLDSGGTMYALTGGYALRTVDVGGEWALFGSGHDFLSAQGRDTLYGGRGRSELLRSTDRGDTWDTMWSRNDVRSSIAAPGGALFLTTEGDTLLKRSADGRWMWVPGNHPSGAKLIRAFDEERLFASDSAGELFRSTNGGRRWEQVGSDIAPAGVPYFGFAPNGSLLLIADSMIVFRSLDNGGTWRLMGRVPASAGWYFVPTVAASGAILGMSGNGTVYRSVDEGVTWDSMAQFPGGGRIVSVDNELVVVGREVWRSFDDGATWASFPTNLPSGRVLSVIAPQDSAILAVGHFRTYARECYRWSTTDGWSHANVDEIKRFTRGPNGRLFVYTDRLRLTWTDDAGATWDSSAPNPLVPTNQVVSDFMAAGPDGSVILAGGKTWRTRDLGATWTAIDSSYAPSVVFAISFDSTGRMLAYKSRVGVVWFDEVESRWIPFAAQPADITGTTDMLTLADGTIILATYDRGLRRSTDGGASWEFLPGAGRIEQIVADERGVLIARSPSVLTASRDRGTTWHSIGSAIGMPAASMDVAPDGRVYAATAVGVFRSVESISGVESPDRPRSNVRATSYPNPVSRSAILQLTFERSGMGDIVLVDGLGRHVRQVFRGYISNASNRIEWSTEGISAGRYYVRIRIGWEILAVPVVVE